MRPPCGKLKEVQLCPTVLASEIIEIKDISQGSTAT
jgi:hypothetical protein